MNDKIFNIYGVGKTAEEIAEMYKDEKRFKESFGSILAMRFYLEGRGFNRVSRAFADSVITAAVK